MACPGSQSRARARRPRVGRTDPVRARLYFSRSALRSWSKSSRRKALGSCSMRKLTRSRMPSRSSAPCPAAQVNRARRLRTLEVVDIDPVARRRHRRRALLKEADYRFALAPRAHAADEDVVAGRVDTDSHPHRVERALLAKQFVGAVARRPHQLVGAERRMAAQLVRAKFDRRGRGLQRAVVRGAGAGLLSSPSAIVTLLRSGLLHFDAPAAQLGQHDGQHAARPVRRRTFVIDRLREGHPAARPPDARRTEFARSSPPR